MNKKSKRQFTFSNIMLNRQLYLCLVMVCGIASVSFAQAPYPDKVLPGIASLSDDSHRITLHNKVIELSLLLDKDRVIAVEIVNRLNGTQFKFGTDNPLFHFVKSEGQTIDLSNLYLHNVPEKVSTEEGKLVKLSLGDPISGISLNWALVLNNDQNFVRQFLEIHSPHTINEIITTPIPPAFAAEVMGTVDGSPV